MSKVFSTKNYDLFKVHESNRKMDASNLQKLKSSITCRNLLEFRPILVNKNMEVIDGQHRLQAAKSLDVDIFYSIKEESNHEDILLLNTNQKSWKLDDYLNYHISLGNEHYKKIKEFLKENNLILREGLLILYGGGKGSGTKLKEGKLKFPEDKIPEKLIFIKKTSEILSLIKEQKINGYFFEKSMNFKRALLEFILCSDVDSDVLSKKISLDVSKITKRQSSTEYYLMLKEIYNFKSHNKI